jgi:hypothetical protein
MQFVNVLLIYLTLNSLGHWEFLTYSVSAPTYCAALRHDVAEVYEARPGNFKIICVDDRRTQI